jgi:hypothetical protein
MRKNIFALSFLPIRVQAFEGEPEPKPGDPNPGTGKKFTQDEVNAIVATRLKEEKDKVDRANQKAIADLKALQAKDKTTEEEKAALQEKIEALQNQYVTEAEQLRRQNSQLEKRLKDETDTLKGQADSWKNRHDDLVINGEIVSAAVQHKAYNPAQIQAILRPRTKFVEEVGADGKTTGNRVPMIELDSVDANGKPTKLTLRPVDAVKTMTDQPDLYGNLFNSGATGGTGRQPANGGTGEFNGDIESLSPTEYLKHREAILKRTQQ